MLQGQRMQQGYREEIDGLRAIAVLPVVLFHAGVPWMSGGYIGVDVFFVISGYLITGILIKAHEGRYFSIVYFYKRRSVRILPALTLVTVVTSMFAWFWMTPSDLKMFAWSVGSVATFSSNVLFWFESGYFDTQAEFKPLLHTWSLAVEEQFYIVFPIVSIVLWKFIPRFIPIILAASAVIGMILSERMARYYPDAAYYLLPSRGWELLVGASLAALQFQNLCHSGLMVSKKRADLLAAVGLTMIACSVFFFSSTTRFPGYNAALPVGGAALVLAFAQPGGLCYRALACRPLRLLGLCSYSTYLWHQPVLSLARLRSADALSHAEELTLAGFSVLLGYLTWRFLEVPARRLNGLSKRYVLSSALASMVIVATFAVTTIAWEGFPKRFPQQLAAVLEADELIDGKPCTYFDVNGNMPPPGCVFGNPDAKKTIVLYGDSHAQALLGSLDEALKKNNIRGLRVNITQCEPIPYITVQGLDDARYETCLDSFKQTIRFLSDIDGGIIVAIRWNYRLYPVPGFIDSLTFDNGEGGVEIDKERIYEARTADGIKSVDADAKVAAVHRMFAALSSTHLPIVIVHSIPETGIDIKRYNFLHFLSDGTILQEISTSYSRYRDRNAFTSKMLNSIRGGKVYHVYPDQILCDGPIPQRCVVQHKGTPFYSDDDHLSSTGAELLVGPILQHMPNFPDP
jgi:peptidoglycan/LPS O-acetylase OafA/YrhL